MEELYGTVSASAVIANLRRYRNEIGMEGIETFSTLSEHRLKLRALGYRTSEYYPPQIEIFLMFLICEDCFQGLARLNQQLVLVKWRLCKEGGAPTQPPERYCVRGSLEKCRSADS